MEKIKEVKFSIDHSVSISVWNLIGMLIDMSTWNLVKDSIGDSVWSVTFIEGGRDFVTLIKNSLHDSLHYSVKEGK